MARITTLTKDERTAAESMIRNDPPSWLETHFYIEDPRDPVTGALFSPGPIILADYQKRILRVALGKNEDGLFNYSTIVYSTIKKSGKTRLAAGVASWFGATQGPYGEIYCLANDGKQSADRILSAVGKCVDLNPLLASGAHRWKNTRTRITLPNKTFIEAIPCDPTGSAGSNPSLTVWSEMWGYTRAVHKERLWTEMTIPPTRWGRAVRWVESYAGFSDDPGVLWDLYETAVVRGRRHPAFPDLPVYVNDRANMFCYWDSGDNARRMPWQSGDHGRHYYAAQAETMRPEEFDRVHRNMWATSLQKAISIELWDRQEVEFPRLDNRLPCVMAVDASVSYDCCAAVLVTRHPDPSHPEDDVAIRKTKIWEPPRGGQIDLGNTIEACIYDWCKRYHVVEVAYDRYQLHSIMTKARRTGIKTYDFSQVGERNLSDKGLYDWLITGKLFHDGDPYLRAHVDNAAVKIQGEKYRFVKPEQNTKVKSTRHRRPIDALVAASMGVHRCKHLNLDL